MIPDVNNQEIPPHQLPINNEPQRQQQTTFFGRTWNAVTTATYAASSSIGKVILSAAESPFMQGMAAFTGGVSTVDPQIVLEAKKATTTVFLGAGKYLAFSNINFQEERRKAAERLTEYSPDIDLPQLLAEATPQLIAQIDNYLQKEWTDGNLCTSKYDLWKNERPLVEEVLKWMLPTGAVNLITHMEKQLREDSEKEEKNQIYIKFNQTVLNHNFGPVEKLLVFYYEFINHRLEAIREEIQSGLENGDIALPFDFGKKALRDPFQKLSEEIMGIAFGDAKKLTKIQRLGYYFAKGYITKKLTENFSYLKVNELNADMKNLDLTDVLEKLLEKIDSDAVIFFNKTTQVAAKKMGPRIAALISKEFLSKFPALSKTLDENEHYKKYLIDTLHVLMLKIIFKHVSEGSETRLTLAEVTEKLMGSFAEEFSSAASPMEEANKLSTPQERQEAIQKIFRPMAKDLYSMVQSEIPLPFPALLKDVIEKKLLEKVIPNFIATFYQSWNEHQQDLKAAKETLREIKQDNHAEEVARVCAGFVAELLPHLMKTQQESLAEKLFNAARDYLRNSGVEAFIKTQDQEQLRDIIKQHLPERSEEEIEDYLANEEEIKKIIYSHFEESLFEPSTREVLQYLNDNTAEIRSILSDNLLQIGTGEVFKAMTVKNAPVVEAAIAKIFANIYRRFSEIDKMKDENGHAKFLPNLGLIIMNTIAKHLDSINEVRVANEGQAAFRIPDEKMIQGFQETTDGVHPGVPISPEALEARKIFHQQTNKKRTNLRRLARANKKLAVANPETRKYRTLENRIARYKSEIAAAKECIKAQEKIMDAVRFENMQRTFKDILSLADLNDASDLTFFAKDLRGFSWGPLAENALPNLGVALLKKFMNSHVQNKILSRLHEILSQEQMAIPNGTRKLNRAVYERVIYDKPEDPTQLQIDGVVGKLALSFLETLPPTLSLAAIQLKSIRESSAEALGGMIRQKLNDEFNLISLLEMALTSSLPSLTEGRWETENGQSVFVSGSLKTDEQGSTSFEPGELSFNMPDNPEAQELIDLREEAERSALEKQVDRNIAKAGVFQMKVLARAKKEETIRSVLKKLTQIAGGDVSVERNPGQQRSEKTAAKLWLDLHDLVDSKIEDHLGSFALESKEYADIACRFFIFTVAGSVCSAIIKPGANLFWWVVELYLKQQAQNIRATMQMGILEDLYLRIIDDVIENLKDPENVDKKTTVSDLTKCEEKRAENKAKLKKAREDQYLGSRFLKLFNPHSSEEDNSPLISPISPFVAEDFDDSLSDNIAYLNDYFEIRKIKADGHELFRSIAMGLLGQMDTPGGKAEIAKFLSTPDTEDHKKNALHSILEQWQAGLPIEEIMTDPLKSNEIVKKFREIACDAIRQDFEKGDEAIFSQHVLEEGWNEMSSEEKNAAYDHYLEKMASMEAVEGEQLQLGGWTELAALSRALNINLLIITPEEIDLREDTPTSGFTYIGEKDEKRIEIPLLFTNNRYDLAIRKKEGDDDLTSEEQEDPE